MTLACIMPGLNTLITRFSGVSYINKCLWGPASAPSLHLQARI